MNTSNIQRTGRAPYAKTLTAVLLAGVRAVPRTPRP